MTISRLHWLGLALAAVFALPLGASGQQAGEAASPGRPVVVHAGPALPADSLADATLAVPPSQPTTSDNSTSQPNTAATADVKSSAERKAAADAKPAGDVEDRQIGGQRRQGGTGQGGDAISQWLGPTWWALLIVLGLIVLAAYVLKRITPGMTGNRQGGLFRILARWHLSPKQLVALIQVGRRMLLVGVTGQQMNLLSEITDPAEIDYLLANCPSGKSVLAEGFSQLLGRQRKQMDEPVESGAAAGQTQVALDKLGDTIDRAKSRLNKD